MKRGFWVRSISGLIIVFMSSCGTTSSGDPDGGDNRLPLDELLGPGEVRAGVIEKESELLQGVEAHGWIGDYKLYNDRVAFVVQNIEQPRGWAPYGGTLLDADRIRPDGQSGEELFEEMFLNVDVLTMFPTSAEVISDGSDGQPAVLRITGEHRGIPLVDAALNGALVPKDLEIVHEYILDPDVDFLRIRTSLSAGGASGLFVKVGDLIFNGDQTTDFIHGTGICDEFPGGQYDYFAGFAKDVCFLYTGIDEGIQAVLSLEGITPLVAGEGVAPPRADQDDSLVVERVLVVGEGSLDACLRILAGLRSETEHGIIAGNISDRSGKPENGVMLLATDSSLPDGQNYVDQTYTDESGDFELQLPPGNYRLVAEAAGRERLTSQEIALAAEKTETLDITLPEAARLSYNCTGLDRNGSETGPLPCKISFQEGPAADKSAPVNLELLTFGVSAAGSVVVPPGDWTVTFSRGWEYSIHRQDISVQAGEVAEVDAVLQRQVDTTGYIAADLHTHCTRSVDSTFEIEDKIASNICEGLDLVVLTDHDCQTDFTPYINKMREELAFDLDAWIRMVPGNEVSPMYAHSTVFPLPTHPTGWIYWQVPWTLYEDGEFSRVLEYPEIWPTVRDLGAQIINVAHPLSSSGYFNYLGFDPPGIMPRIDSLDAQKFSPDFDTLELLNSDSVDRMLEMILPMWSHMNNQGFFRTAVGVSDSHQRDAEAGFGRTMIASSSDDPDSMDLLEIWTNLRQGHAMVAGGIFVNLSIADAQVGELISASGTIEVHLHVEAADWVPAEKLVLLANGEIVGEFELEQAGTLDPQHPAVRFEDSVQVAPLSDTWYAAIATGPEGERLDPVFRGCRAVGVTNALKVDVDGNGKFDPPTP